MPDELKGLIEKIQEEGIKAAEDKAGQIEAQAQRRAKEIIDNAEARAQSLTREAAENIARIEESAKLSIRQAGRDLLIALRKEINAMLDKLIVSHVHKALTPQEFCAILKELIKGHSAKDTADVVVLLKEEDLDKMEKAFLCELRDAAKNGITLKASDDIHGGFAISYDSGRSYYDFTDKALAEYLSSYIKPKLAKILNEALDE